jgi:transposase
VTTLYFESFEADELRNFGFSNDCNFKETQVMPAPATTTKGLPITYRLFPGNTYEGGTLPHMVVELTTEYSIKNILPVADQAMFNENNLSKMEERNVVPRSSYNSLISRISCIRTVEVGSDGIGIFHG